MHVDVDVAVVDAIPAVEEGNVTTTRMLALIATRMEIATISVVIATRRDLIMNQQQHLST